MTQRTHKMHLLLRRATPKSLSTVDRGKACVQCPGAHQICSRIACRMQCAAQSIPSTITISCVLPFSLSLSSSFLCATLFVPQWFSASKTRIADLHTQRCARKVYMGFMLLCTRVCHKWCTQYSARDNNATERERQREYHNIVCVCMLNAPCLLG